MSFITNAGGLIVAHLCWKLKWDFLIRPSDVCLLVFYIIVFSRTAQPIKTKVGTNHP
jgi:hypothetical protein